MIFIKNIVLFVKKVLKKERAKMIEKPQIISSANENRFINELMGNVVTRQKKIVKVPIRYGDGLGIQDKIEY